MIQVITATMPIMKFVILIALVVAVAAGAQGIHGPRSTSQELDHLTMALHLTDMQRGEIEPLLEQHHDRIKALFDNDPTLSPTDVEPQIHAIGDQTLHEIDELLTPTQLQVAKRIEPRSHL